MNKCGGCWWHSNSDDDVCSAIKSDCTTCHAERHIRIPTAYIVEKEWINQWEDKDG